MRGKQPAMEMANTFIEEGVDLVLAPGMVSQVFTFKKLAPFGIEFEHSVSAGFFQSNIIAARIYPGSIEMFAYFKCFPRIFWVILLLVILLISFLSSLFIGDLKQMLNYFLNFLITLISGSMSRSVLSTTSH